MKEKCRGHNRSGARCGKWPAPGFKVCELHGGKSHVGAASPQFKHGRYSKYLPANLRERYETAANDPDLLVLRDEIALIDARVGSLLPNTSVNDPPDSPEWREINTLLDLRRRLVESDRKRLVDLHQMVSATEATMLIARLAAIVREHVTDRNALNAIQIDFAAVLRHEADLLPVGGSVVGRDSGGATA